MSELQNFTLPPCLKPNPNGQKTTFEYITVSGRRADVNIQEDGVLKGTIEGADNLFEWNRQGQIMYWPGYGPLPISDSQPLNLVNPIVKMSIWINLYDDGMNTVHTSRDQADRGNMYTKMRRIGCVCKEFDAEMYQFNE